MKETNNKSMPKDHFKVFEIIKKYGVKLNYLCEIGGLKYNNVTTQMSKDRVLPETANKLKKALRAHVRHLVNEIARMP